MHQMNVIEVKHKDHQFQELAEEHTKAELSSAGDRFMQREDKLNRLQVHSGVEIEEQPGMAAAGDCGLSGTLGESLDELRCISSACEANRCAGCQKPIRDKFIFSVIDLSWHQDCVQCADCSSKLNERCYTVDGKLYCKLDYRRRFGPKCFACKEPIGRSELVQRIKGNRVYHLKCFTCDYCQKRIMAGEQLHLLDDARLLCKHDFNQYTSNKSMSNQKRQQQQAQQLHQNNGFSSNTNGSTDQQTYYTLTSPNDRTANLPSTQAALSINGKGSILKERGLAKVVPGATGDNMALNRSSCEKVIKSQNNEPENDDCELDDEAENLDDDYNNDDDDDEVDDDDGDDDDDDEDDDDDIGDIEQDLDRQIGEQVSSLRSLDGAQLHSLSYDANDSRTAMNLENDENHSAQSLANSLSLMTPGNKHKHLKRRAQRQYQQEQQRQQQMLNGSASKSKRARRRREQKLVGISQEAHSMKKVNGNRATTNSAGESILNSLSQSASILATNGPNVVQLDPGSVEPASSLASSGHHQQQQQQQQQHHHITSHLQQQHNNGTSQQQPPQAHLHNQQSQLQGHHHANHNHHHHHHHSHNQHHLHNHHSHNASSATKSASSPASVVGGALGRHNGPGSGAANSHKPTRVRTVLNEKQLQTLRDCYAHNPRPDALMKEQLVDLTGLSPRVIRVWFQNKRCKDKKKSILYKQMQQNEKDGRHLTSLMRGVHLVASSPIQYDDHSTVSSLPSQQQQQSSSAPNGGAQVAAMLELQAPVSPSQQSGLSAPGGHALAPGAPFAPVHSPGGPVEIHAYQPPWKNLIEYASGAVPANPNTASQPPSDVRPVSAASPRYQQLMSQIHGYNTSSGQPAASQERTSGELGQVGAAAAPTPRQSEVLMELQRAGGGQFQAGAYVSAGVTNSSGAANPADQLQLHLSQQPAVLHQFHQS